MTDKMKKYSNFSTICLAVMLTLVSCTQDELTDSTDTLPEGMYPLEIASATLSVESSEQPWTRVSESEDGNSSVWDGSETIGVQLGSENTTYQVNADGTLTLMGKPLYWQNTQTATITAWYPATDGTLDLSDQSAGLKYVLKGTGTSNYQSAVTLNFSHALAKVRVVPSGSQVGDVQKVEIYSYTTCTHMQGTVSGANEGWITMQYISDKGYYEANVVPGQPIMQFRINETVEGTLDNSGVTPVAASLHTINLTVGNKVLTGGETVTEPGDYTISGNITEGITINGDGITLTLDGATVNTSGIGINVQSGSPTIKVSGTGNSVTSSTATAIHVNGGTTLTIEGVNGTDDKLTTTGGNVNGTGMGSGNAGAGIGSSNGGNIVISNVTIEATGSTWNHFVSGQYGGGAAIGSTVPGYCGDITITDAVVNATGGYMAAAIGMGGSIPDSYNPDLKIGKIDIRNSVITAKGGDGASAIGFASMESASLSSAYAGEIYIEMTETSSAFLNRLTISNGNYKIGKGYYYYYTGRMTFYNQDGSGTWPGVTLKASDGTQTSADGIGQ